jgi:hypothetical protein
MMAYKKVNWSETTPVTASNLNQMEEGIANAIPQERFKWEWLSTQPTHIWGTNGNPTEYKVFNPADLSVSNATKINNMQVRGGSGLTGASGYITFSW